MMPSQLRVRFVPQLLKSNNFNFRLSIYKIKRFLRNRKGDRRCSSLSFCLNLIISLIRFVKIRLRYDKFAIYSLRFRGYSKENSMIYILCML